MKRLTRTELARNAARDVASRLEEDELTRGKLLELVGVLAFAVVQLADECDSIVRVANERAGDL